MTRCVPRRVSHTPRASGARCAASPVIPRATPRIHTHSHTHTHKNWQLDMRKRIRGNLMKGGEEAESKAAES